MDSNKLNKLFGKNNVDIGPKIDYKHIWNQLTNSSYTKNKYGFITPEEVDIALKSLSNYTSEELNYIKLKVENRIYFEDNFLKWLYLFIQGMLFTVIFIFGDSLSEVLIILKIEENIINVVLRICFTIVILIVVYMGLDKYIFNRPKKLKEKNIKQVINKLIDIKLEQKL